MKMQVECHSGQIRVLSQAYYEVFDSLVVFKLVFQHAIVLFHRHCHRQLSSSCLLMT
jgi:hypothetical protein